jgi:hypothetical protein
MAAGQKQNAQWDTQQGREDEPRRASKMNVLPVLHNNDGSDGNRHQHNQRSGHAERNTEGEQRNRNQTLAKTECRSNQRGDKYDD